MECANGALKVSADSCVEGWSCGYVWIGIGRVVRVEVAGHGVTTSKIYI